jgi:LemA protein
MYMSVLTILLIAAALLVLYLISTYNFFQTALTRIKASIQEIGNQLKRQADLIPNLEASVKGYLKHEKDILTMLADARKAVNSAVKSGDVAKQTTAASMLGDVLPKLSVIVESNPQLQGSTTVTNLMEELRDTADKVMYSRRTLIDLSADYNIKVVTFPSNLVANIFGFKEQMGLKVADMDSATSVSAAETKSPKISL